MPPGRQQAQALVLGVWGACRLLGGTCSAVKCSATPRAPSSLLKGDISGGTTCSQGSRLSGPLHGPD